MKVVDLIKHTNKTAFSFEVLPPLKGTGIEKLYQSIDTLREFDPQYIKPVLFFMKEYYASAHLDKLGAEGTKLGDKLVTGIGNAYTCRLALISHSLLFLLMLHFFEM